MSNNKYTLKDFMLEYGREPSVDYEVYIGLDFDYRNQSYRLSREWGDNGRFYLWKVSIINPKKPGYVENLNFETLGIYDTIDGLLDSTVIDNRPLKELLFCSETEITGQD